MSIAVIFDMDGVIAHTNPTHDVAWRVFLQRQGVTATDAELYEHMYGKHNSYILSYFLKRPLTKSEIDALQFEKEAIFRELYRPVAQPMTGLLDFLNNLKQNHIKTGIATSAPVENLELILELFPIRHQMESLLSESDVTHHKPAPEVYLKSAQNLGVNPARCVVFEDSISGVQAGLNAGMKVVGVTTTYTPDQLPPCHTYVPHYEGIDTAFVEAVLAM
jgi:beta-phosphoglucomutase